MSEPGILTGSAVTLLEAYDALLADLDGVVYLDDQAIPGAAAALQQARDAGLAIAFVTNNAAHAPADVVRRLSSLDVTVEEAEVVTSSMAAAELLARDLPAGAPVLVVGGAGLWQAVEDAGFQPVRTATGPEPAAVVQGWGPDVCWADLAEATVALRAGARWIATNLDRTLPSPRGPLPGSGSLVAAVQTATGRRPDAVAGKPHPPLFAAARRRCSGERPLVLGDRLDTDIAGAREAGLPSLLVLTGVSTAADLLAAPVEQRPTYIGADLSALTRRHPRVDPHGNVRRGDADSDDGLDGLRSLAARAWSGVIEPTEYDAELSRLDLS